MNFRLMSVALILVIILGCSTVPQANYSKLGLVQVSGTVTMDGNPLSDAMVRFENDDKTYSSGVTDATGRYTLRFNSEVTGITPGKKRVMITKKVGEGADDDGEKAARTGIPAKYNSASTLSADVSNEQTTFDWKLTSN